MSSRKGIVPLSGGGQGTGGQCRWRADSTAGGRRGAGEWSDVLGGEVLPRGGEHDAARVCDGSASFGYNQ